MKNKKFFIEIRESNLESFTHINILDFFNNENNIIEINNKTYKLNKEQFESINKLTENNLIEFVEIAREQTPDYLNENTVDGFGSNLLISIGGLSLKINNAAIFGEKGKSVFNFIEQIKNIIEGYNIC